MPLPLLIGLVAGLFALAAAIVTVIGVLVSTKVSFKLGKKSGDVQQQTADTVRMEALAKETEALRAEISRLWQANQELRHQFEMADVKHEAERDGWDAEKHGLVDRSVSELRLLTAENEAVKADNADLRRQLEGASRKLVRTQADLETAQRCQAQAEGGLHQARRTISEKVCALPETTPPPNIDISASEH